MIVKVCLFVCLVGCVHSWGRGDWEQYGPLRLALYNLNIIQCNHSRTIDLDASQVDIYFYDFAKNTTDVYAIEYAAEAILSDQKLDKNRKIIMFVLGFRSQIKKQQEELVRQAYKNYPNSYLIIPDHSVYTNNNAGNKVGYERAVRHVHYIGKALGRMLAELNAGGIKREQIHCIGHSLGAQMLAHTGQSFFNITGSKIPRISALDPAGPCFSRTLIHEQIRSGVADYVEVYHCNSGLLGTSSIIGDVDFIINKKGETQPDCNTPVIPAFMDSTNAAICNHNYCVDIWLASLKNPQMFPAYRCDSDKSFKGRSCGRNDMTLAGDGNPCNVTGIFYLSAKIYEMNSKPNDRNSLDSIPNIKKNTDYITNKRNDLYTILNKNNSLDSILNKNNDLKSISNKNNNLDSISNKNNNLDSILNKNNDLYSIPNKKNDLDSISNKNNVLNSIPNKNIDLDSVSNKNNVLNSIPNKNNDLDSIKNKTNDLDFIPNKINYLDSIPNKKIDIANNNNDLAANPKNNNDLDSITSNSNVLDFIPNKTYGRISILTDNYCMTVIIGILHVVVYLVHR